MATRQNKPSHKLNFFKEKFSLELKEKNSKEIGNPIKKVRFLKKSKIIKDLSSY